MKYIFKLFLSLHVLLYRLSGGRLGGNMRGFKVLLLNTVGRKTGKAFTTPLGWFDNKNGYIIMASNAGQSTHPSWYYNLISNPKVAIQVLSKIIPVTAEVLSGEPRSQAWRQVISTAPSYAEYEKSTTREIPIILLHPGT